MQTVNNERSGKLRMRVFAACEWLLILPATVFLAASAPRMLQPRQYEPARTRWMIFEWTITHLSRFSAAVLFIAMPGIVLIAGGVALMRNWRREPRLRHDSAMTLAILRRHLPFGILAVGVLLAGTILTAVLVHIVTD